MKKTITHYLRSSLERPAHWTAIRFKRRQAWIELNWSDYYRSCESIGLGLLKLGVERGDRVAILSNTRWEWAALDMGILGIGAVTVPVYQSYRAEELEYLLNHSDVKVLVVEDKSQLKKYEAIQKKCKSVKTVVQIEPNEDLPAGVFSWDDLINRGSELAKAEGADRFAQECEKAQLDDLATIVYTSGTTGEPKGVMLAHRQILSEVEDVVNVLPISPKDSTLSFLPYAHVMGRVEMWLHMYLGFTLNFAESIDKLRGNLKETRPTVILGVPRVFEKIYSGILTQLEGAPWRKKIFQVLNGSQNPLGRLAADQLIFKPIREGLGGRLRFVVSGGAPLEKSLADFFKKADVLLLEGYGLSETAAAIALNTPDNYEFGTVGAPLPDVKIMIAPDGEILVKSDKVMKGYYRDEQATKEAFKDGYFCTGDVGEFNSLGHLKITDRKKDLIKTAGGKYIAPQKLEGMLKMHPAISNVLIHGDRKKFVVALLTLNEPYIKALAKEKNWAYRDYRHLTQLPEIREVVRKIVAQVNANLASFETIKNFSILPDDFSIDRGELTPSLKVKRKICDDRYSQEINELY